MSNQALRQASVRAATGTVYDYNGDWSALFDLAGVPAYDWNGRLLTYINLKLGTAYTEINGAMAAFAIANGAPDWNSLGTFSAALFDPAATALFARMTVQPDNTRKALINSTILGFKSAGIWTPADAIHFQAAHDAQAARLNWKGDIYNLTAVNSPVFIIDRGYGGDGVSAYLDTGLAPGAAGLKFQQNSAHYSFYDRTIRGDDSADQIGVFDGACASVLQTRGGGLSTYSITDSAGGAGIATTANHGLYAADRSVPASFAAFKNGASVGTVTTVSVAPVGNGAKFFILCLSNNNTVVGPTQDQVGFTSFGASLGSAGQGQLYTIVQAYMTAIGANV